MTAKEKLMHRLELGAEQYMEAFPTASALLQQSMMEAMPWVISLKTQGKTPNALQLERLATQILAILMASLPREPEPAAPLYVPEERTGAKVHSFK